MMHRGAAVQIRNFILLVGFVLLLSQCEKHQHAHDSTEENAQGVDDTEEEGGYEHEEAHPEGHDHHAEGHGHGDSPVVSFTLWGDGFEVFGEYEAAVLGRKTVFLLHLTTISDFLAVKEGSVSVEFEGPDSVSGKVQETLRPGIFRVEIPPAKAGKYQGLIRIEGEVSGTIEGLEMEVFDTVAVAVSSVVAGDDAGLIEFLKEQQWGVPFGTAFAKKGSVVASVQASGRVETPPGGSTTISAPVTGRLAEPVGGLARPGSSVKKGQLLATLIPAPSSPEGGARAGLAVAEAESRASAARVSLRRAERLIQDEAISERELEDAQREAKLAERSVKAAKQAAALYSRARGGSGQGSWRLSSPISGTLVWVKARPGATVSPGDPLFHIVDTRELWLVARVTEQDAARLRMDRNASYRVAGLDDWNPIVVEGDEPLASVVNVGQMVDPITRTVDVIYSLSGLTEAGKATGPTLRVGGSLELSLPAGRQFNGIVLPRSSLIDQEGRSIVYVQVDGEHFQERAVTLGPQAGAWVGIVRGLGEGERVVTKGAHLVRLADRSRGTQAHGHIH